MGRIKAVLYRFQECQCLNVAGKMDTIPAGIHAIAELDVITLTVGPKRFDLDKAAFNQLKAEGKVTDI
ncbi:TPA: hypothetical protein ACOJPK_003377 [Pseudomonas putida]|uniref:hypothetical protein n=1 Tax=Pseudomonas sp. TaxID=306 RepID=UPI002646FE5D|nr:hypothetical protein [Pseudomonas sp.]MDN5520209.1 hypothetical protein [Pseudomonas sp.]MDN5532006.1 hypothetical protein [Pseudomonas sp.]